jgi:hypothetical protein
MLGTLKWLRLSRLDAQPTASAAGVKVKATPLGDGVETVAIPGAESEADGVGKAAIGRGLGVGSGVCAGASRVVAAVESGGDDGDTASGQKA